MPRGRSPREKSPRTATGRTLKSPSRSPNDKLKVPSSGSFKSSGLGTMDQSPSYFNQGSVFVKRSVKEKEVFNLNESNEDLFNVRGRSPREKSPRTATGRTLKSPSRSPSDKLKVLSSGSFKSSGQGTMDQSPSYFNQGSVFVKRSVKEKEVFNLNESNEDLFYVRGRSPREKSPRTATGRTLKSPSRSPNDKLKVPSSGSFKSSGQGTMDQSPSYFNQGSVFVKRSVKVKEVFNLNESNEDLFNVRGRSPREKSPRTATGRTLKSPSRSPSDKLKVPSSGSFKSSGQGTMDQSPRYPNQGEAFFDVRRSPREKSPRTATGRTLKSPSRSPSDKLKVPSSGSFKSSGQGTMDQSPSYFNQGSVFVKRSVKEKEVFNLNESNEDLFYVRRSPREKSPRTATGRTLKSPSRSPSDKLKVPSSGSFKSSGQGTMDQSPSYFNQGSVFVKRSVKEKEFFNLNESNEDLFNRSPREKSPRTATGRTLKSPSRSPSDKLKVPSSGSFKSSGQGTMDQSPSYFNQGSVFVKRSVKEKEFFNLNESNEDLFNVRGRSPREKSPRTATGRTLKSPSRSPSDKLKVPSSGSFKYSGQGTMDQSPSYFNEFFNLNESNEDLFNVRRSPREKSPRTATGRTLKSPSRSPSDKLKVPSSGSFKSSGQGTMDQSPSYFNQGSVFVKRSVKEKEVFNLNESNEDIFYVRRSPREKSPRTATGRTLKSPSRSPSDKLKVPSSGSFKSSGQGTMDQSPSYFNQGSVFVKRSVKEKEFFNLNESNEDLFNVRGRSPREKSPRTATGRTLKSPSRSPSDKLKVPSSGSFKYSEQGTMDQSPSYFNEFFNLNESNEDLFYVRGRSPREKSPRTATGRTLKSPSRSPSDKLKVPSSGSFKYSEQGTMDQSPSYFNEFFNLNESNEDLFYVRGRSPREKSPRTATGRTLKSPSRSPSDKLKVPSSGSFKYSGQGTMDQSPSYFNEFFNLNESNEDLFNVRVIDRLSAEVYNLSADHRVYIHPNGKPMTWEEIQKVSNQVQPKMFGKQAMEAHMVERSLILDRLGELHASLDSRPPETSKADPPIGLKTELMGHQSHALAWLRWRETQRPRGGILADDMGLGKTITMISLMALDKESQIEDHDDDEDLGSEGSSKDRSQEARGGTLIVCPASLLQQWAEEVTKHCKSSTLTVTLHHGANRATEPHRLTSSDLVVTTYNILQRESKKNGVLMKVTWHRVILDEAHKVRNHKAATSVAASKLKALRRWAVTGTPVQNKDLDVFALLKFLKCTPFDDLAMWKKWIDNKSMGGQERLNVIMSCILLRRTKQQLKAKGQLDCLPERTMTEIDVKLTTNEMNIYQQVLLFSKSLFAQYLYQYADKQQEESCNSTNEAFDEMQRKIVELQGAKTVVKSHQILVLLLRLRQICCHCGLIASVLDEDAGQRDEDQGSVDLLNQLIKLSIDDEGDKSWWRTEVVSEEEETTTVTEAIRSVLSPNNPAFNLTRMSSKIQAVFDCLHDNVFSNPGEKAVVVSQWTSVLRLVEAQLNAAKIGCVSLTGQVPVAARAQLVNYINDPNSGVMVMLLSLCAGGVGLNLCGANHLLLLDPHWNPQLEQQAQDRIYRVGQTKDVRIYRFICLETVEQNIRQLQEEKLELAENILTGAKKKTISKLTIEDLKMLFNM